MGQTDTRLSVSQCVTVTHCEGELIHHTLRQTPDSRRKATRWGRMGERVRPQCKRTHSGSPDISKSPCEAATQPPCVSIKRAYTTGGRRSWNSSGGGSRLDGWAKRSDHSRHIPDGRIFTVTRVTMCVQGKERSYSHPVLRLTKRCCRRDRLE